MKSGNFRAVMAVTGVVTFGALSSGFISTRSSNGAPVTWGRGARLAFRTNQTTTSNLLADQIFSIFTTSLNRWKQAAGGGFDFTYYQGSDAALYPNYLNSTADNSIFFTSNANNSADRLPCGLVAVTQVWYNTSNGQASKADLRFNDNCFEFTDNPADTVSQSRIYLGDVATHELGHALGLDHSQSIQSSMVYTAAIQEADPSCDDLAAMSALYGNASRTGTIGGNVQSPGGGGLFGAFVEAVSLERGTVVSSAMTDTDGSYNIRGLEAGSYRIVVSPFYPGASSLGRYYGAINTRVCGGSQFARTFGSSSVRVEAGGTATAPSITASCAAVTAGFGGAERTPSTAPTLTNTGLAVPAAAVNVFSAGATHHYYALRALNGRVEVHALAYSLYSPADVSIEILDVGGRRLSGQQSYQDVFSAPSGYINFDAMAAINETGPLDVIVHVYQRGTVPLSSYPSGSLGVDYTPFYMLTASQGLAADAALYPQNPRCEQTDSFAASPRLGDPGRLPAGGNTNPTAPGAGCGTINNSDGRPTNHDPFQDAGAQARLINFSALVMMLMAAQRILKRQKAIVRS